MNFENIKNDGTNLIYIHVNVPFPSETLSLNARIKQDYNLLHFYTGPGHRLFEDDKWIIESFSEGSILLFGPIVHRESGEQSTLKLAYTVDIEQEVAQKFTGFFVLCSQCRLAVLHKPSDNTERRLLSNYSDAFSSCKDCGKVAGHI